ncbi:MAG: hypothetical protein NZ480_01285, partial [Bdellovibrionaceae bacterium]|nr:hypothetical protein [Pseudobdellovibrionaceae bacterium]
GNKGQPLDEATAQWYIEKQLTYMFGPMGKAKYPGVPKGDHIVEIKKIEPIKERPGYYQVHYRYEGTVVVHNDAPSDYYILLPNNPREIYKQGLVMAKDRNGNLQISKPCTDPHYNSEADFWYFWNPSIIGCPLKKGDHYQEVKATLRRKSNMPRSFPEYPRLVRKEEQSGDLVIPIFVFLGMDEPRAPFDPYKSGDYNAPNYRYIMNRLLRNGFSKKTNEENNLHSALTSMNLSSKFRSRKPIGFLETMTKTVTNTPLGKPITIRIDLYFGPTGILETSYSFHLLFKYALEHYSVMVYDGHSGLGGNLNLNIIEDRVGKIQIPKDKYQIYFFNSCSSYPYYNTMYFNRKVTKSDPKGRKNLDILTNGLATYFSVLGDSTFVLIDAIERWASNQRAVSYQAIAREIESQNLFGVNGDEDNPTAEHDLYQMQPNF